MGAVSLAVSAPFSGVYVVMHADTSDNLLAVHRGTRVRKNHTSARDAFRSIGVPPVARWSRSGLEPPAGAGLPARSAGPFAASARFDDSVALLKFYPSMKTSYLEAVLGSGLRGVVIEGTGLGHINGKNIATVRRFVEGGGLACMTSQCVWGRVDMDVYDNGRDLLAAGVIPLEDMLAETALAKLMWVLANCPNAEERAATMRRDLAGETTERSVPTEGPA